MSKSSPKACGRHKVEYGSEEVEFDLFYLDKKHLSISVTPDSQVKVYAPAGKTLDQVLARVRRRMPWIIKQKRHFNKFKPPLPPRQYVSGETHIYLGRQYRLKVIRAKEESVKLKGKYLYVRTPDRNDSERIKVLVENWYNEHARAVYEKKLEGCYQVARKYGVPYPGIKMRRMKTRWGSCSKSGDILLNTELIKAPIHCVEYVIMHELCHMKVRNHDKEFYKLLSRCMPDWKRRKKRLESVSI